MVLFFKKTYCVITITIFCALANSGFLCTDSFVLRPKRQERLIGAADNGRVETVNGRTVRKLWGNVRFRQGEAVMSCDSAIQYVDKNVTNLMGNVCINTGKRQLYADMVRYNENTRVEEALGNVVLYDSTRILHGDFVTYFENEERAIASGNVLLTDTTQFAVLTCGHIEYERVGGYAAAWQKPILTKTDSTGEDSIQIYGAKMELFETGKRAVVRDSVLIVRKALHAQCGFAEYRDEEEKIILTDQPIATRKFDTIYGDRFELFLKETEIETILVMGDALITSPMDTLNPGRRLNELQGQTVTMVFEDEHLCEIIIKEQGSSSYYLVEEGEFRGVNNITGDLIKIYLVDDELQRVRIESTPGKTTGTYYPPHLEHLAKIEAEKSNKRKNIKRME